MSANFGGLNWNAQCYNNKVYLQIPEKSKLLQYVERIHSPGETIVIPALFPHNKEEPDKSATATTITDK